jgi:predicted DNA-binding WGR domain protein
MEKKFCLLKISDGTRGASGKKKIYEVTVSGRKVTMSWGMAEKPNRQTKVEYGYTENDAMQIATNKVGEKLISGYQMAYSV